MASGKPQAARVSAGTVANEMRNEFVGSVVGMISLAATTAYIYFAFEPLAPRTSLLAWLIAKSGVLGLWALCLIVIRLRQPSDEELLRVWARVGQGVMTACNLVVAASAWLLMPHAPEPLRLMMAMFYLGYIGIQLLISTEGVQVGRSAVVVVLGSVILFFAVEGGRYGLPVALFLSMVGGVMLAGRRLARRHVVAATEASERLREALAVVAAERDARTRFIRAASHDLSQPLQAARLFFDRMRRARDPAEREQAAAGVTRAFASTAALLDEMLMHLRLDAGAVRSVPDTLDVDSFVAQLAFDHGPAAVEAGMRLRTPRSGLSVEADPHLLKRVLNNLISNGLRHSRGESVLIAARRAGPCRVRIWVLDDGDGIPAELEPRLFEDFAQGAGGAAREGGFGLGLASVRKLAEAMDGTAGHEPRWRSGGAFYVELPAGKAQARALPSRPSLAA
jgi:signal transduction histidine kinase